MDEITPMLERVEDGRRAIEALQVPPNLARWLQRVNEARGAHLSTRIEGNRMTEREVRDAFTGPARRTERAEIENLNYRDAVRFAGQLANDVLADIDGGVVRALHFLVVRDADDYGTAGQYRVAQNAVRDATRSVIYLPPHETEVGPLMNDLVGWLRAQQRFMPPLVLAAVAHAEFINIHPFDDGNGRAGRALASYLVARGGWRLRGFVRIEQVFGTDIEAYYARLAAFGDRYPGQHVDFTEWVRWFLGSLEGHISDRLHNELQWELGLEFTGRLLIDAGVPQRAALALMYVDLFDSMTADAYAIEASVSRATAVSDLNVLVGLGRLSRIGNGRATRYERGPSFTA